MALAAELLPDLAHPVDLLVLPPNPTNVIGEDLVLAHALRSPLRIPLPRPLLVVHGRGDRRDIANRLDPELRPVLLDEADHHLCRRSSSALAKYAEASRRISLARRNSKFSRSSCLRRSRSSLVSPGRWPASRSACRTHFRSVSALQPIFSATELIAAHCESCAASCSTTIRTARARTSGENLVGLSMAPSSQNLEPPRKSARFTDLGRVKVERLSDVKPSTVNRELAFSKHLYDVAIRDGRTERNPVAKIRLLKEPSGRTRYLTDDEEAALMKAFATERDRQRIVFLIHTGLRKSEFTHLRWKDLDLRQGVITIPRLSVKRM